MLSRQPVALSPVCKGTDIWTGGSAMGWLFLIEEGTRQQAGIFCQARRTADVRWEKRQGRRPLFFLNTTSATKPKIRSFFVLGFWFFLLGLVWSGQWLGDHEDDDEEEGRSRIKVEDRVSYGGQTKLFRHFVKHFFLRQRLLKSVSSHSWLHTPYYRVNQDSTIHFSFDSELGGRVPEKRERYAWCVVCGDVTSLPRSRPLVHRSIRTSGFRALGLRHYLSLLFTASYSVYPKYSLVVLSSCLSFFGFGPCDAAGDVINFGK